MRVEISLGFVVSLRPKGAAFGQAGSTRLDSKWYAVDCFGTGFSHVQTRDNVRVQGATQGTASVQTLHMSKRVITFLFKVCAMDCFRTDFAHVETCDNVGVQSVRNGLLPHRLCTCPNM